MWKASLFFLLTLFCYQTSYTANIYAKLPTQKKIEQIFAKHELQNLEQKLHIGILNNHKTYSVAGLSYQTILWSITYAKYSKQNNQHKLQTKCAQSIAELIKDKYPFAKYHYEHVMRKIAEFNELPTILYQLESELGIMHAVTQKRFTKKNIQQPPKATTPPNIRQRHSIG